MDSTWVVVQIIIDEDPKERLCTIMRVVVSAASGNQPFVNKIYQNKMVSAQEVAESQFSAPVCGTIFFDPSSRPEAPLGGM